MTILMVIMLDLCLLIVAVYPTLNQKLQEEWDEAEQARYEGLITEQVEITLIT